jgi:hypothetical protein
MSVPLHSAGEVRSFFKGLVRSTHGEGGALILHLVQKLRIRVRDASHLLLVRRGRKEPTLRESIH